MKKSIAIVAAMVMAVSSTTTALAGVTFSDAWYKNGNEWRVNNGSNDVSDAWLCDDAVAQNGKEVWYMIGKDGNMMSAGLVQDSAGNYYSLEQDNNGYYGMMRNKPGVYDGITLDIETEHNSRYGAIKNQDGIEALKAKYGVTPLGIGNESIVYTSTITTNESEEEESEFSEYTEFESTTPLDEIEALGIDLETWNYNDYHTLEEKKAVDRYLKGMNGEDRLAWVSIHWATEESKQHDAAKAAGYDWNISQDEIAEVDDVIADFIDNYISDDMTDFEKEMAIVQYLCDNVEYDYSEPNANGTYGADLNYLKYTEYGALVEGSAVCQGYARAFYLMGVKCGLTVNQISGISTKTNEGHAWNMIKLDDGWYYVDVCWADQGGYISTKWVNATGTFESHTSANPIYGPKVTTASGKKYKSAMVSQYLN